MQMLDLRKNNNRYYFKLGPGDDFWDTIRLLKNTFQPKEREYHPETKEWSVPATAINEAKLAMIFENAEMSFAFLKAQLPLFPELAQPG